MFYHKFADKIKGTLKEPLAFDKNLNYDVKKQYFEVLNVPSLGASDVLVVPMKEGKEVATHMVYSFCLLLYVYIYSNKSATWEDFRELYS